MTIAGSREESGRIVSRYVAGEGGRGSATLIGGSARLSSHQAALANGVAAHALDFDDTSSRAGAHASAPLLAATLATAERMGASPIQFMDALAAVHYGQSLIVRSVDWFLYERGFHRTGTNSAFGAAIGVGRVLGLNVDR